MLWLKNPIKFTRINVKASWILQLALRLSMRCRSEWVGIMNWIGYLKLGREYCNKTLTWFQPAPLYRSHKFFRRISFGRSSSSKCRYCMPSIVSLYSYLHSTHLTFIIVMCWSNWFHHEFLIIKTSQTMIDSYVSPLPHNQIRHCHPITINKVFIYLHQTYQRASMHALLLNRAGEVTWYSDVISLFSGEHIGRRAKVPDSFPL